MKGASIMDTMCKTLLARALYDNHPDCSDELAFCRGDILTILEQNVPESEGWWKCLLHGRQGLAPANRLQILMEAPTDRSCPPFQKGLQESFTTSEETYLVPTMFSPPPPVYEHMKSWVEGPPPPRTQHYELPDPPPSARIVCEKTMSFPKQVVVKVPKSAQSPLPTLPPQVYDVPIHRQGTPTPKEPSNQWLYDIPPTPQKARISSPASPASGKSTPLTSVTTPRRGGYNTLPNPQKSEWIYNSPVSSEKANIQNTNSLEQMRPCALPRHMPASHSSPSSTVRSLTPHLPKNVPMQKKLSLPEIPSYHLPAPRSTFPLDEGVSYKVPSSFLVPRVEQQNTKPNIYDIPKAMTSVPQPGKDLGKATRASENSVEPSSSWFSKQAASFSPDLDTLSISSVISSCSSVSTDSSSSSFSEESSKELFLDLELAKEKVTTLQHHVAVSVADLMLFVSRKWRFRDYLEANIDAIHRAVDHIEESLREFLDFARGVYRQACNVSDNNLQVKIKDQLQTISNSYQILLETKEKLESFNWSLEVLVTNTVQNSPDALERFVMVARMVPEDIKRFASIVIANGRLLFKQNCEREENVQLAPNTEFKHEKCTQLSQKEINSQQSHVPFNKQREHEYSLKQLKKTRPNNVCDQNLPNLEEKEKTVSEQRLNENKVLATQTPDSSFSPRPLNQLNPEKRIHLSEHCRLYFGALFKAINVFHNSLSNNQPPEVFITQSKLIIMVGQKLVDSLCKETQDRDARNEILYGSNHLCSLLKNLALATKHAVLKYPSPAVMGHLQAEAQKLEQHAQQFREMLE